MFKIADGRTELYQWDINRKLVVLDDSIKEVHFYKPYIKGAIPMKVEKGIVNIPNELLQDYGILIAYGFIDEYTKIEEAFNIVRKEKPIDYIYTPTEIYTWEQLDEKKLDNSGWTPNKSLVTDAEGNVVEGEKPISNKEIEIMINDVIGGAIDGKY